MNLDNQLNKYKKPDVNEAVDFLQRFVQEEMDAVAHDIIIKAVDQQEETEEFHSELEQAKRDQEELALLYKFKTLVRETKYCSFRISCPNGDVDWHITDTVPEHLPFTVRGNNLRECLRQVINLILSNREATTSSKYRFKMKCPANSSEYEVLANRHNRVVEV